MPETMSPREKVELKPCPFCASRNLAFTAPCSGGGIGVLCRVCHTNMDSRCESEDGGAEAWNRRAALASSCDHAELALNAKAAQTWALGIYENRDQAARRSKFIDGDLPATVLALIAEVAALRGEKSEREDDWAENLAELRAESQRHLLRATEAERKLAEAVAEERARGQVIINERDKWIVELIRERDAAKAILRDAVSEAIPDAMVFAGHPDAQRYSKALDGLRIWTDRARTFLSKEAERG